MPNPAQREDLKKVPFDQLMDELTPSIGYLNDNPMEQLQNWVVMIRSAQHIGASQDKLTQAIMEANKGSDQLNHSLLALNKSIALATWVGAIAAAIAAGVAIWATLLSQAAK